MNRVGFTLFIVYEVYDSRDILKQYCDRFIIYILPSVKYMVAILIFSIFFCQMTIASLGIEMTAKAQETLRKGRNGGTGMLASRFRFDQKLKIWMLK